MRLCLQRREHHRSGQQTVPRHDFEEFAREKRRKRSELSVRHVRVFRVSAGEQTPRRGLCEDRVYDARSDQGALFPAHHVVGGAYAGDKQDGPAGVFAAG